MIDKNISPASCPPDARHHCARKPCAHDRASHQHAHLRADHRCHRLGVLASASTAEKGNAARSKAAAIKEAAAVVGKRIAERAKAASVTTVAFDRSRFAYHGRVKALAEAAREAGLKF